jgi:hypothetical protein
VGLPVIEVLSGFVTDGPSTGYRSGGMTFLLGEPPKVLYSPSFLAGTSFSQGDFIAVAAKRTFIPGADYVALAYRNLGVGGDAQWLNPAWPGLCLIIGGAGACALAIPGPVSAARWSIEAITIAIGAFGIARLLSMRKATRLLNAMQPPLTCVRADAP